MSIESHEIAGLIGALLVLVSYFLLQANKMKSTDFSFSLLNLIGSLMLMYSLTQSWNLASFFIEVIWGSVSVYGLYKWFCNNRKKS
jgi:NADH:ubiquinone oxidoreductase subunit 2 (subunit N)